MFFSWFGFISKVVNILAFFKSLMQLIVELSMFCYQFSVWFSLTIDFAIKSNGFEFAKIRPVLGDGNNVIEEGEIMVLVFDSKRSFYRYDILFY